MAKNLLQKLSDNYNDVNLQSLDEHIEAEPKKTAVVMISKHTGPTKVKVTEKSMKKLAKVVLDL